MPRTSKSNLSASYSDKELKEKFFLIMLIEAVAVDERQAFYYLAVSGSQLEAFKRVAEKKQVFDLADYGSIILSGYGSPTKEVIDYMEENFGMKHSEAPRLKMTENGLQEVPYTES